MLYDFKKILPKCNIFGLDISNYALEHCKKEISSNLIQGSSCKLPWEDNYFDLVVSITTLHNLYVFYLEKALKEMERVGKNKYLYSSPLSR